MAGRLIYHPPFKCTQCGADLDALTDVASGTKADDDNPARTAVTLCCGCGAVYESTEPVQAILAGAIAHWKYVPKKALSAELRTLSRAVAAAAASVRASRN